MRRFVRWRRLSARERRAVVAAAALLAVLPLGLRARAVPRLLPGGRSVRAPLAGVDPQRMAALVSSVAARLPWSTTCLQRALAAAWLLAWSGEGGTFVMAVVPPSTGFAAHAWIEIEGRPCEPLPAGCWQPVGRWPVPQPLVAP